LIFVSYPILDNFTEDIRNFLKSNIITLRQGFSNYGSRPQMGWRNVTLGVAKNWLDKSDIQVFVYFTK